MRNHILAAIMLTAMSNFAGAQPPPPSGETGNDLEMIVAIQKALNQATSDNDLNAAALKFEKDSMQPYLLRISTMSVKEGKTLVVDTLLSAWDAATGSIDAAATAQKKADDAVVALAEAFKGGMLLKAAALVAPAQAAICSTSCLISDIAAQQSAIDALLTAFGY